MLRKISRNAIAFLWKPFPSTRITSRIAPALVVLAAAEAMFAIAHPAVAQAPAVPAVRVERNFQLGGRVWPVDLNSDGITDLVSTSSDGRVQVSIGKGDGTFNAPVASAFQGEALATGDFNGDKRPDVVASRRSGAATDFVILPGTGTATLGAAVTVVSSPTPDFTFALSADFNGDGKRDLVLPSASGADIYPGHGDFSFAAPVRFATSGTPLDGIAADLNHDGRTDLVTASGEGGTISIFINRGGFVFTASDMFLGFASNDVTVADLDRDGSLDLVIAAGRTETDSSQGDGYALILHGNGDGTFGALTRYDVARGAMQIVVGDFNRDGVLDVVTGNRSSIARDDCATTFKTWDSVSVLAGLPNGTLAAARNFSIGDQSLMDPTAGEVDRYRDTLLSLNTSDLNGDGATDLIASYGAILFNIPAVANRPPTADFGPDRVLLNDHGAIFRPAASDPDNDVLTYDIRDAAGNFHASYPNACFESVFSDGDNTVTVTVNDGHGHSASDSVVYTVSSSSDDTGNFATRSDIGGVGAVGSDSFDSSSGVYTVRGSGSDIWGTADEFHYVWTQWGGDFDITTRVDAVQNINAWTKAGIMIRGNLNPGSLHASLFATPGKGVAFQRRAVENGVSVNTDGPATTAPVWLKLHRDGAVITAYYRKATTDAWTTIGRQTIAGLPDTPLVGLAVSSHADGKVATASFSNVTLRRTSPLSGTAIGTGSGSLTSDGVSYTVTGNGADIWGTADAFYYVSMPRSDDVTITARVRSLAATHDSAKAGVMIREDLTAGSRQVMTVVMPGKGVAMQYRATPRAASVQAAAAAGHAPGWVRLTLSRSSATFTSSWSSDGEHWTVIGTVHLSFAASTFYVGLPVSSHTTSTSTTAVFDDVAVEF
ncbi:MAG: hypothetical protein JWL71_4449 [Acidobacteria bacterium]|nr:hypothetical protein [Acidobacteriota bacterium]